MNTIQGQYYEPYESDVSDDLDDTDDADDTYDTDDTDDSVSNSEDQRIGREEDPRYMILQSKSLNIPGKELSKDNPTNQYAEYDTKTDITSYKDLVYLNPPKGAKISLFCLRSDSRDAKVYPSPMNFTIKLPRIYKNVTKLQLVQISFPNNSIGVTADGAFTSSFVTFLLKDGVQPCCISTCVTTTCGATNGSAMGIVEQGRLNASGTPLMTTLSIPDGAYTSRTQMGNELTYQANNTPPFNLITYETFRDIFMNTRDISVLFNEPGDCFSSKTNNKRYGAHTKENIMTTYYTQQHIDSFPEITEVIAFNAYYYPILKELLATQRAKPFLNTGTFTFDAIMNLVMGTFEGLQSDIYYTIGQLNQNSLDIFRQTLTFELRNINKYQWIHDEETNKFITIHDTLHTSLHNDIQKQYQTISNQELSAYGLHANSFKSLKTSLIQYKCIYKHLETNLSTILGNYHFVSGYQYHGGDTHSSIESTFHCLRDLQEDCDFSSMFCYQSTIGRMYGNYAGIRMNFTSFQDYHSTLSSYYTTIQSTNQTISSINRAITNEHHEYVSTKYHTILPQYMIENQSYLSNQGLPVRFITDRMLYVPGQSIVPRQTNKRANMINTIVNTGMSFETLPSSQTNTIIIPPATMPSTTMPSTTMSAAIMPAANEPFTTPSAPTITSIVPGNTVLIVRFTPPTSDGGIPIIGYKITWNKKTEGPVETTSPFTIPGLINGTPYVVSMRAVNVMGDGENSNTITATPTSDNCNGQCSCSDPSCCKYCDLEAQCYCTDVCCGEIESLISSWYSCLPVNTVINTLSYRLGVLNPYLGYNITSTVNSILPPFNNNLFMSLNDEMGFNNMDVAMPEDYSITNETTGQVQLMFAKIMFTGVGKSGESQTLFQNPLTFDTPLGKLDRLTFKIYYDDAAITPVWLSSPFPQLINEWNAIINIEEEVSQASRLIGWSSNPTLPIPNNPNATPYLAFTSADDPNNASNSNAPTNSIASDFKVTAT
jgi:hypothetical protein